MDDWQVLLEDLKGDTQQQIGGLEELQVRCLPSAKGKIRKDLRMLRSEPVYGTQLYATCEQVGGRCDNLHGDQLTALLDALAYALKDTNHIVSLHCFLTRWQLAAQSNMKASLECCELLGELAQEGVLQIIWPFGRLMIGREGRGGGGVYLERMEAGMSRKGEVRLSPRIRADLECRVELQIPFCRTKGKGGWLPTVLHSLLVNCTVDTTCVTLNLRLDA